jgi:hypothetical protein
MLVQIIIKMFIEFIGFLIQGFKIKHINSYGLSVWYSFEFFYKESLCIYSALTQKIF